MKKFLTYLAIIFAGVICVDVVVRLLFSFVYSHVPQGAEIRQRYKYEYYDNEAEVLIVGASRAMFCYKPSIISDTLNMTTYNVGMDGAGVVGNYLSLKKAVGTGKVKVVVYDCGALQLSKRWNQGKISNYFPFYWMDSDVRKVVDDFAPQEKWKLYSSLLQYNSCYHDIVRTFLEKTQHDHGFQPLPYTGKGFTPWYAKQVEKLVPDSMAAIYLDKFVSLCKKNNITLFITMCPGLGNFSSSSDFLSEYAREKNVEFWDFTDLEELHHDSTLFKDYNHLNERGVDIFTPILAHKIKLYLNKDD